MRKIIAPQLDVETLSKCHALLCKLEMELRQADRAADADMLSYIDLLVLVARNQLQLKLQKNVLTPK